MPTKIDLPLSGILVLDFSQFLAGPVAALRLADLGARVIKVERPTGGDIGRELAFAGLRIGGDTVSFQAMNRNKEGLAADLKDPDDLAFVKELVARADVLIQNFRPGVMERIGLDYESVRAINPRIVYASASGYGETGPWRDRPGQDLLAQAMTGMPWLNGGAEDGPIPVGLSIADHLLSCHIAQGVTALLVRRFRTGRGGLVNTSLLESMLDLQFELLSAHLNDPSITVRRAGEHSAHAFLPAPYGTYPTSDGYIALAMNSVPVLGALLEVPELERISSPEAWWSDRSGIEDLLSARFAERSTNEWLAILDSADVWCAPVLTLQDLVEHDGFAAIDMVQTTSRWTPDHGNSSVRTTRSPLRIDGRVLTSSRGAPLLGEHSAKIKQEFAPTIDVAPAVAGPPITAEAVPRQGDHRGRLSK